MLKFSTIRKAASMPPPTLAASHEPGPPRSTPFDSLPLNSFGRMLLANFTPGIASVNGEKRLIWLELWRAHLYPAEYYGPTSHREI